MQEELKVCAICGNSKRISEYNKHGGRKDGLQSHCKECNRARSKAYYSRNRESHKKTTYARKKKQVQYVQQYVYNLLKERGCIECPEKDPVALDFDHVRGTKKRAVGQMVCRGTSLKNVLKEIEKCEIRCANCHRKRTAKQFEWYKNIVT